MKSENKIQQEIYVYFTNTHCLPSHQNRELIFHVPNENQHHLMNIGVLAGVSDLIFTFKKKLYFCEVKTETGKQSPAQKEFQKRVEALGFPYIIARSLEDFKSIIS